MLKTVPQAEIIRVADAVRLMDWNVLRNGLSFCLDLTTKIQDSCIERTSRRTINGRVEERHYYHSWVPFSAQIALHQEIVTLSRMLANDRPYASLIVSDLWGRLRQLSLIIVNLHIARDFIVPIEAPWRWRDFGATDRLPDDETMQAFEAIITAEDYKFAAEFVRQQVRTDAWRAVTRGQVK